MASKVAVVGIALVAGAIGWFARPSAGPPPAVPADAPGSPSHTADTEIVGTLETWVHDRQGSLTRVAVRFNVG